MQKDCLKIPYRYIVKKKKKINGLLIGLDFCDINAMFASTAFSQVLNSKLSVKV